MTPERYFGDPERIVAASIGLGAAVLVALGMHMITRGLERWLWWRP